jgi:hypothetical protein
MHGARSRAEICKFRFLALSNGIEYECQFLDGLVGPGAENRTRLRALFVVRSFVVSWGPPFLSECGYSGLTIIQNWIHYVWIRRAPCRPGCEERILRRGERSSRNSGLRCGKSRTRPDTTASCRKMDRGRLRSESGCARRWSALTGMTSSTWSF